MKKVLSIVLAAAMLICGAASALCVNADGATEVSSLSQIKTAGNYILTADVTESLTLTSGDYTIDLNGYGITGSITVNGANLVLNDSSNGGGSVYTESNDAIMVDAGSIVVNGVEVSTMRDGCDGFFVTGGSATINDCIVYAQNAAVQNTGMNAKVVINGGKLDSENHALKVKNNAVIEVGGGVSLNGNLFLDPDTCSGHTLKAAFVASEGWEVVFTDNSGVITAEVKSVGGETATDAPETTPEVTDAPSEEATQAPETDGATKAPEATAETTEIAANGDEKTEDGGCGSIIGGSGLAAVISLAALILLKKRR